MPHAGTWIEIRRRGVSPQWQNVVPHAGTWIEIFFECLTLNLQASCLTQARGLKSVDTDEPH